MNSTAALHSINADLRRQHRDPDWWQRPPSLVNAQLIRLPLARGAECELLAREFFTQVAQDDELLYRRQALVACWQHQRKMSNETHAEA